MQQNEDPDPDSGLKAGEEQLGVGSLTHEQTEVARDAIKNALCFGSGIVSFIRRAFEMNDLPRLTDAQLDVEILQLVQEQDGLQRVESRFRQGPLKKTIKRRDAQSIANTQGN